MSELNPKMITPTFRGSFVNILKPKAFSEDQDPKYSMTIVLPKDEKFLEELNAMIKKVAEQKWGEVPKKLKTFFKDGDEEDEKYGWSGMTVFTVSNKSRPGIVVKTEEGLVQPNEETLEEEIYSGAHYRCAIRPYAYEYNKTKGVAISLDNVMKVRDDEKFTSRTSASEDFADFAEGDWD